MHRPLPFGLFIAAIVLASGGPAVTAPAPDATLVDVHAIEAGGPRAARPIPATANCSNDSGTNASDYAYTGWQTAGGEAQLNATTIPAGLGTASQVVSALEAGFAPWNTGGAPRFTVGTGSTATKQKANRQTDLLFARTNGGSLAVTYTWRWSDGTVESDTVFNTGVTWKLLGSAGDGCLEDQPFYDLQNIAAHEFGHIYGLDHPSGARYETMYMYGYTGETLKRTLGAGDGAGLAALY